MSHESAVVKTLRRIRVGSGYYVIKKLSAAAAKTGVNPAGVQAARLPAAVVHAPAAVEAHALLGGVGEERAEDGAVLHLVAAVVPVRVRESVQIVRRGVVRLGVSGKARHRQAKGPFAAN